jgi:hypothetical protein
MKRVADGAVWTETHFSHLLEIQFFSYPLKQTGIPIARFGSPYFRFIVGLSLLR